MQGTVRYVNVSYGDIGPLTIGIRTKDKAKAMCQESGDVRYEWNTWNQSQTFIKIVKQFS